MPIYHVLNKNTGGSWQGEAESPEAALEKLGLDKKDAKVTKVSERGLLPEEPED